MGEGFVLANRALLPVGDALAPFFASLIDPALLAR
jgi:hypothetical protein